MVGHGTPGTAAAKLAAEYRAAHYFVSIGQREWLFGVGKHAPDIERQLGALSYFFITAWNPAPRVAALAENLAADGALQKRIRVTGLACHKAWGSNPLGGAVEQGWLVLDAALDTADAWAREFRQAGILYWRRGGPVCLRMYRPRPGGIGDDPCVEWAGCTRPAVYNRSR